MADQLSNFLVKFRHEWQAGKNARLQIECHAGKAWITLHQPLGYSSPPAQHHPRRPGPSRLRRRARRADARAAASAAPTGTAEMAVQADLSPATVEAAVQATSNTAHGSQSTAAQAGPRAEQAQHRPHHVADAVCPDGWYHSPAVQAVAVPPRHGGEPGPVWAPPQVLQPEIPQLDGAADDQDQPRHLQQHQCETCYMIFENRALFDEHDKAQFCCDDCNICYITQLDADLHNLEVHPDEHYTRTYVPESTKHLFASKQPRK